MIRRGLCANSRRVVGTGGLAGEVVETKEIFHEIQEPAAFCGGFEAPFYFFPSQLSFLELSPFTLLWHSLGASAAFILAFPRMNIISVQFITTMHPRAGSAALYGFSF